MDNKEIIRDVKSLNEISKLIKEINEKLDNKQECIPVPDKNDKVYTYEEEINTGLRVFFCDHFKNLCEINPENLSLIKEFKNINYESLTGGYDGKKIRIYSLPNTYLDKSKAEQLYELDFNTLQPINIKKYTESEPLFIKSISSSYDGKKLKLYSISHQKPSHEIDPDNLSIINTFELPTYKPGFFHYSIAIAYDGKKLRCYYITTQNDHNLNKIHELDLQSMKIINESICPDSSTYSVPGSIGGDYDGENLRLYYCNGYTDKIYELNPDTLQVLKQTKAPLDSDQAHDIDGVYIGSNKKIKKKYIAINNKKYEISSEENFDINLDNIINIGGTATPEDVLQGKTIITKEGLKEGLLIDRGESQTITPSISNKILEKGVYKGDIIIKGDSNLKPENIKKGVNIFGIEGNHESIEITKEVTNNYKLKMFGIESNKVHEIDPDTGSKINSSEIAINMYNQEISAVVLNSSDIKLFAIGSDASGKCIKEYDDKLKLIKSKSSPFEYPKCIEAVYNNNKLRIFHGNDEIKIAEINKDTFQIINMNNLYSDLDGSWNNDGHLFSIKYNDNKIRLFASLGEMTYTTSPGACAIIPASCYELDINTLQIIKKNVFRDHRFTSANFNGKNILLYSVDKKIYKLEENDRLTLVGEIKTSADNLSVVSIIEKKYEEYVYKDNKKFKLIEEK